MALAKTAFQPCHHPAGTAGPHGVVCREQRYVFSRQESWAVRFPEVVSGEGCLVVAQWKVLHGEKAKINPQSSVLDDGCEPARVGGGSIWLRLPPALLP